MVDPHEGEQSRVNVVDGTYGSPPRGSRIRRSPRSAKPRLNPPPANHIVKPARWWSRPFPWAIGVRPNSEPKTTIVSSSMPRCFRSMSRAAAPRSTSAAVPLMSRLSTP